MKISLLAGIVKYQSKDRKFIIFIWNNNFFSAMALNSISILVTIDFYDSTKSIRMKHEWHRHRLGVILIRSEKWVPRGRHIKFHTSGSKGIGSCIVCSRLNVLGLEALNRLLYLVCMFRPTSWIIKVEYELEPLHSFHEHFSSSIKKIHELVNRNVVLGRLNIYINNI